MEEELFICTSICYKCTINDIKSKDKTLLLCIKHVDPFGTAIYQLSLNVFQG